MPKLSPKAVSTLLATAKEEYNNENTRISNRDAKTNITLPAISAYLIAILPYNSYSTIFSTEILQFSDILAPSSLFITYTSALILASISLILMIYVVLPRQYATINPEIFYDALLLSDNNALSIQLIKHYTEATAKNRQQNNKRALYYKRGCILLVISIISFVIYNIIRSFQQ